MEFQFDPAKAAGNLCKHGVSFADAESLFSDPLALHRIDPDREGEERFVAIGAGSTGPLLVVVYAVHDETIRLISARRATPAEIRAYET
jgi:uncharacterized DUF497 family protein